MTKRKFYKTVFKIEVLSEEPLHGNLNLSDLDYKITKGNCSGTYNVQSVKELNGKQIAKELEKQGSGPEFFQIDAKGNDIKLT